MAGCCLAGGRRSCSDLAESRPCRRPVRIARRACRQCDHGAIGVSGGQLPVPIPACVRRTPIGALLQRAGVGAWSGGARRFEVRRQPEQCHFIYLGRRREAAPPGFESQPGPYPRSGRRDSGNGAVFGRTEFHSPDVHERAAVRSEGGAKWLRLDLNRNQDLTDDPAGVIPATALFSVGPSFIHQMFTNVPLSFPATSAGPPMLVDLELGMDLVRRPGEPLFTAGLRSYWQGKVTREGHDWQVGLMQNLSDQPGSFQRGELLLRPWEERNKRFIASCEVPMDTLALAWTGKNWMVRASDAFAFSPRVFFEGHACQLDWSAEPRGREESLALRLTEQQTALGELQITGSFIQRLVLTGGPYVIVLAH